MTKFCLLLFSSVFFSTVYAQDPYPSKNFSSPIENKLVVSSNFGKIRSNHFHAGFDINTKLKSGMNIYAVADGYISRVNISEKGYGKAIYITHPNGNVSVYAHLSQFEERVSKWVYQQQHLNQRFNLDMDFEQGRFPVKKGYLVGKSGNTGLSFGAHLHFEIRDELTEEIINPLLFGYNIYDTGDPVINALYFYYFYKDSEHPGFFQRKDIIVNQGDTLRNFNIIGMGLEMRDYVSKKNGNLDVYQLKVFSDDSLIFHYRFDRFSFDDSRYINSFIDYSEYKKTGKRIIKCYKEPNNKLNIYQSKGNGLIDFTDGKLHKINILASDYQENTARLDFYIQSDSASLFIPAQKSDSFVKKVPYNRPDYFSTDTFKITFNKDCLYDNLEFKYHVSHGWASEFSKYHYVHNPYVPLHKSATIAIKPHQLPDRLSSKAIIVGIGRNGARIPFSTIRSDGYLLADINAFGTYYISVDTVAPIVKPVAKKLSKNQKLNYLNFIIKDDLSGIDEFMAYIDHNWVLFEYDAKNDLLSCDLKNENITEGNHSLILWVRDKCNNLQFFETEFKI